MPTQNLVVTFATKKIRVAKSLVVGLYVASILADAASTPVLASSPTPEVTVTGFADGTYTITSGLQDSTGAALGDVFTDVITVKDGTVTVEQVVDGVASTSFSLVQVPDAPVPDASAA